MSAAAVADRARVSCTSRARVRALWMVRRFVNSSMDTEWSDEILTGSFVLEESGLRHGKPQGTARPTPQIRSLTSPSLYRLPDVGSSRSQKVYQGNHLEKSAIFALLMVHASGQFLQDLVSSISLSPTI